MAGSAAQPDGWVSGALAYLVGRNKRAVGEFPYRQPEPRLMRYLGALRGAGTLGGATGPFGRADYELDGYLMKPGEVVPRVRSA